MAEWNPQSFHCTDEVSSYKIDLQALSHMCATDAIEGTVFSRAWILSLLVKMIDVIQPMREVEKGGKDTEGEGRVGKLYEKGGDQHKRKHSSMEEEDVCVSKTLKDERFHDREASGSQETLQEQSMEHMRSNSTNSTGDNNVIIQRDLEQDDKEKFDEGTENDLCQLWDATANTEVSFFLHEHHAVELMTGVISRSSYNRLTEICVGVLNNMACNRSICLESFCNASTISLMLSLMSHSDTGVLTETSRLIITCLSHDKVQESWLNAIKSSNTLCNEVVFILESSTNDDLLRNISILLDTLLDLDLGLLMTWSHSNLVQGICEAANQCRFSAFDVTCIYMLTLQLFTTIEDGITALFEQSDKVYSQIVLFLQVAADKDTWSEESRRGLMGTLSLCEFLLENSKEKDVLIKALSDSTIIKYLQLLSQDNNTSNTDCSSKWYVIEEQSEHYDDCRWQHESTRELSTIDSDILKLCKSILAKI